VEGAVVTRRRFRIIPRLRRRRDGEQVTIASEKRQFWVANAVTLLTTAIVAGTAMYATLKTSADGRLEERRGARVDALVEHWSTAIADASTAVELLAYRSNNFVKISEVIEYQGVLDADEFAAEKNFEKRYLEIRSNLAGPLARVGLVSSISTVDCLTVSWLSSTPGTRRWSSHAGCWRARRRLAWASPL